MHILNACIFRLRSSVRIAVDGTTLAGPHEYPGPGPSNLKFLGNLTVLLEVPESPTPIWNEETAPEGFCPQDVSTPPLQQLVNCMLKGAPGSKSTTSGFLLQLWGIFNLNLAQFPCSVAWAPTMAQIISFFAHVHPRVHPGFIILRYNWKLNNVTVAYQNLT